MGMLDELKDKVMGAAAPARAPESSGLVQAIFNMVANREGGLPGLVSAFQAKGLGDVVSSWISTGKNLPISREQVQSVVGAEQVQQLAASAGVSPDAMGTQLANFLPRIVDGLTPNGSLPQEPITTNALDALKKLF